MVSATKEGQDAVRVGPRRAHRSDSVLGHHRRDRARARLVAATFSAQASTLAAAADRSRERRAVTMRRRRCAARSGVAAVLNRRHGVSAGLDASHSDSRQSTAGARGRSIGRPGQKSAETRRRRTETMRHRRARTRPRCPRGFSRGHVSVKIVKEFAQFRVARVEQSAVWDRGSHSAAFIGRPLAAIVQC
jgi:hypothetical protein